MATDEQRARRRAQRSTARNVAKGRNYAPVIPRGTRAGVRAARESYARDVIAGREPYPPKGSKEGKNLASLAAKARHGKADPAFEKAFSRYWYHKEDEAREADAEDNADYESGPDDTDNEED